MHRTAELRPAFTRPDRGTLARLKLPLEMNASLAFSAAPPVPTCKRARVPRSADSRKTRRAARQSVSAKQGPHVGVAIRQLLGRRDIPADSEACHAAGWKPAPQRLCQRTWVPEGGAPEIVLSSHRRVQVSMALGHPLAFPWPTERMRQRLQPVTQIMYMSAALLSMPLYVLVVQATTTEDRWIRRKDRQHH